MRLRLAILASALLLGAAGIASLPQAMTAANTVSPTRASNTSQLTGAETKKPGVCASVTVTTQVAGSGMISGGAAAELVIGSPADDTISGGDGDDCLVGGDGNDLLDGGPGYDVCVAGPGSVTYDPSCEVQI